MPKKLSKKTTPAKQPNSFRIFYKSLNLLKDHWKLFAVIAVIYGLASLIFVRGASSGLNLTDLKATLQNSVHGDSSSLVAGATLVGYLFGNSNSSNNPTGGVYQTMLIILFSLVIIWSLRQILAGKKINAKAAFYNGTYPLIQFVLVLAIIGLQLLPLLLGSWLFATVASGVIGAAAFEQFLWAVLALVLAILSVYWLGSSVFALYIVTLPQMTPIKALRSAKELVSGQRWTIIRKVLFLPLALLVLATFVMLPIVLLVTAAAEWIFFGLGLLILPFVHAYMYTLYRELL